MECMTVVGRNKPAKRKGSKKNQKGGVVAGGKDEDEGGEVGLRGVPVHHVLSAQATKGQVLLRVGAHGCAVCICTHVLPCSVSEN